MNNVVEISPPLGLKIGPCHTIILNGYGAGDLDLSEDCNLFTRNKKAIVVDNIRVDRSVREQGIGVKLVEEIFNYTDLISGDATFGSDDETGFGFWQHIGAKFLDDELNDFEMTEDYYEDNCEDGQTFPFTLSRNDFLEYKENKLKRITAFTEINRRNNK